MNHDPVQFLFKADSQPAGILRNPVNTDENIPADPAFRSLPVTIIKSDDIRVGVVLQIGLIVYQQGFIRTEYIVDLPCLKTLSLYN